MVMNETWSEPSAVVAFLHARVSTMLSSCRLTFVIQVGADVEVALGDIGSIAKEDVTAISTAAGNLERVLARVSGRAVESDGAALVTIRRIDWPQCLVPAILEAVRDLSKGAGKHRCQ